MITQAAFFSTINLSKSENDDNNKVCNANISPKERLVRKQFGIAAFAFTLALLGVLVALHIDSVWRLLLFFMFSAATTSYIEALDNT